MFGTKLEKNMKYINRTEEGKQALEDAIVTWEASTGNLPNEQELETITTLIVRQRKPSIRIISNIAILVIIISIMISCGKDICNLINGTYKETTFYYTK